MNIFKELEKNKEVLSDWHYNMEVDADYKYIGITYDNINILNLDLDFEEGKIKIEIKNAEKYEIEIMEILNYKILEFINDVHTIYTSDDNNASITIYTI